VTAGCGHFNGPFGELLALYFFEIHRIFSERRR